jgi:hypothetical protein
MAFYIADNHLPSGFTTSTRVQKITSLSQLESLGILDTHQNETKATGTVTITNVGADGDTITVTVKEYGTGSSLGTTTTITLGSYTKATADTTVTSVAVALKNAINAGTSTHGYTASNSSGAITITARAGLGIYLNSGTPLTTTIVGTITATTTQFSGGVASDLDQVHYHVSEAFRINPQVVIYLGLFTPPGGTHTWTELSTLINFVPGDIRQLGIFSTVAMSTAQITSLHNTLQTFASQSKPCSSVLTMDISGSTLSSMADLSALTAWRVTFDIAQDMGGEGYQLFKALGKSVGTMGATIGAVSLAKVSENIGWVDKFDMSDGTELETIGFGNGIFYNDTSVQDGSLLDTLWSQRYSFLVKFNNRPGTFFVDDNTSAPVTNTFSQIANVRTCDKIVRGVEAAAQSKLNGSITLKADGTMTELEIADFERITQIPLDAMIQAGEISVNSVLIDPTQVVSTSSEVDVTIDFVAIGIGRNLVFNINQVKSLS